MSSYISSSLITEEPDISQLLPEDGESEKYKFLRKILIFYF